MHAGISALLHQIVAGQCINIWHSSASDRYAELICSYDKRRIMSMRLSKA